MYKRQVPASVLRADSPSLPYIHSAGEHTNLLPDSSAVIQVDEAESTQE